MTPDETAKRLSDRIRREDDLVNARANIFLVLNGLGAVAISLGGTASSKQLIAIVGISINVLWFIISVQCLLILFTLTKCLIDLGLEEDPSEKIVQSTLGRSLIFRPNAILNLYIPGIITAAWIVSLVKLN